MTTDKPASGEVGAMVKLLRAEAALREPHVRHRELPNLPATLNGAADMLESLAAEVERWQAHWAAHDAQRQQAKREVRALTSELEAARAALEKIERNATPGQSWDLDYIRVTARDARALLDAARRSGSNT